jgi:subtilisin family serine protease
MNIKILKLVALNLLVTSILFSCGSSIVLSTPIENIDNTPLKFNPLTKKEEQIWSHLDLVKDTIPGMSVNKAYDEIIKNKKGKTVIVAVIDSRIDIDHEDLNDVVWTNKDEIPNNNKDDDKNGYIDDIHGWNFLGDTYEEQLEYVRLLASGNTNDPRYQEAKVEYDKAYQKAVTNKSQYEQILKQVIYADELIAKHLNKEDYTKEEVNAIKTTTQELSQAIQIAKYMYSSGLESMSDAKKELQDGVEHFTESLDYTLNKNFKGRKTGDNPDDFSQKIYGNANVKPINKGEIHGTHVAGIIAAERNNDKGVNGVANNVKIMPVCAVSNGDEYDKDVALAIRYAVDNDAKIINMSFGKSYSPHSNWVKDAIVYASQHDVLIVAAAGNDGIDLDNKINYPNDLTENGGEISDNFISVGAINPKYGSSIVANYSNYGKQNVDIFAPGTKIYSTFPNNTYESIEGTSMASPAVAGVAALVRSQYPNLKASQVKQILMSSGLSITTKVIVSGNPNNVRPFSDLSKSGKLINAYNALILAKKISNNQSHRLK